MKRVDIKVGFSCNNSCKFCVQGNKRNTHKDKTTDEIKDILREAVTQHQGVVFTGGEVTIRNDLPELVSYAKELGFEIIQIQSNGRRFAYLDYCKEIIAKGANEFALALHGPDPAIHDGLTRAKGSFHQTTTGMQNLVSLGQKVLTNTVITKPNYKKLPELADLFIDLGVSQFQFAFIHINQIIANDPKKIKEIVPKKSKVMPFVKRGLQKGIDAGLIVMTEAIPFCFMKGYEKYIAEAGKIPDGAVYDGEINLKHYATYRQNEGKVKGPKCQKCKYFHVCEGPWKEYPQIFGWKEFKPIIK